MLKSGLILGITAFVLVLGSTTLLTPLCAPCLGLFLGFATGYVSGVYDKPGNAKESIRVGAMAGAIAGSLGFIGGMIGAAINGAVVNPSDLESIYRTLGMPSPNYDQATIWILQLVSGFCVGLFNIVWMAILGVAGGAVWFQTKGRSQTVMILPPQEPIPPAS